MAANRKILDNLLPASNGDEAALTLMYEGLIEGPLFVPRRFQAQRMSDQPDYPNDLVDVLGLNEGDRVIVPVFAEEEAIERWCGNKLTFRELNGKRLAESIPDGWWAVLCPDQEGEKDLSPWELEQLRGGKEMIPALLHELRDAEIVEPLEVAPPADGEYAELRRTLAEYAAGRPEISCAWVLKESGLDLEGQKLARVLVGIETETAAGPTFEALKGDVRALCDRAQIGADPVKLFIGSGREALILGAFKDAEPIYRKPRRTGRISRLLGGK